MPAAMSLPDASCRECGQAQLVWWREDETEDTLEVYVSCAGCGFEYPKRFVSKSDDTSRDRLEQVAREVIR